MNSIISSKQGFTLFFSFICSINLIAQSFTDVANTTGLNLVHDGNAATDFMGLGSGAAWIDYDNDGDQDVYFTQRTGPNVLARNNGDGTFTEIPGALGMADSTGVGAGVAVADFNNDGFDDVYLANGREDKLYKNNGGTSFTDITVSAGMLVTHDRRANSASWGDYDNDGYVDLYISHHTWMPNAASLNKQDFLLHNNGDETFTDVSEMLGLSNLTAAGFIGSWTDFDNDGDLDIILINDCGFANDPTPTLVFQNDGGTDPLDWNFTEVSQTLGVNECQNGMGIAVADYNRDGFQDFAYTNIGAIKLEKGTGSSFIDETINAGVGTQEPYHFSWGINFLDCNNNGWQDLFVSLSGINQSSADNPVPNNFFLNDGNGVSFTDVGATANMDDSTRTRNSLICDYDLDGDLDMLLVNYGEACQLKRNDNTNGNNWIIVKLEGTTTNRNGIGSKVKVTTPDGVTQVGEMRSGSSLGGGEALYLHFGIGTNTEITTMQIDWLSGNTETYSNVAVNQYLNITEGVALPLEWLAFEVEPVEEQVLVEWQVIEDDNSAYYEVEHYINNENRSLIGKVNALGEGTHTYRLTHENPEAGLNYYRIKEVGKDGSISCSVLRSIALDTDESQITIAPNPLVSSELTVFNKGNRAIVEVALFDQRSKQLNAQALNQTAQTTTIRIQDFDSLPRGVYILKVLFDNGTRTTKKIIK